MSLPQKFGKWVAVSRIGEGGQAIVWLAIDPTLASIPLIQMGAVADTMTDTILNARTALDEKEGEERWEKIPVKDAPGSGQLVIYPDAVCGIVGLAGGLRYGALKEVKTSAHGWARDPNSAKQRFEQELHVLQSVSHPNLVRLLDQNEQNRQEHWFVTQYFSRGSLEKHPRFFAGRPLQALLAFCDLVDAVRAVHAAEIIHRDIKPANIFVGDADKLVLGDMGLAFVAQADGGRVTETFANVGTRDWMPPWAIGRRQDEVRETFDVFALGKILFCLVAGVPTCANSPDRSEIASACRNERLATRIQRIVSRCVVMEEERCIPTACDLLDEVDQAIAEAYSPAPSLAVQMAAHAITRPGELFLLSVEAPMKKGEPDSSRQVNWRIHHERARGRGLQIGIHNDDLPITLAKDDPLWNDFQTKSADHNRWLITPPPPRSRDNYIECLFLSPGISLADARYLSVSLSVDDTNLFRLYLRFGDEEQWINYAPHRLGVTQINKKELSMGVPELLDAGNGLTTITRDVAKDLERTWGSRNVSPKAITGIRFRGAFSLLYARII